MRYEDEQPRKHFVHTHASHFMNEFLFHAYGTNSTSSFLSILCDAVCKVTKIRVSLRIEEVYTNLIIT